MVARQRLAPARADTQSGWDYRSAFPFTAQVADGITTATLGFSITIAPPPLVLQTTSLPSGEAGAPYSAPLSATGGVPPYNWSASGLPHGLTVDPNTGTISGPLAPDATTSTNVVLKVTDSTNTPPVAHHSR